ncbi:hypothetical protein J7T55_013090 [Diaporthe amygdali]|uniref:uncharacterized protein n=1 Tax=Phomopsis amygdali TaxID=1214568 RepID=UPI0022FE08AB|nr:uncharacterized protein J7T55_013090 [Diaporthe amygdali]KAJ0118834.1 hypothetical protein J7T55_013090 [Diaporthe amygdali]
MDHEGDDLRDLSYLANADVKLGLNERDSRVIKQKPDTRESLAESFAESAVLPRESAYGPPPPVPAKDSIYIKRKMDFGHIGGHTDRDHCFNIKYISDETERHNAYASPFRNVAARIDQTGFTTSFDSSADEAGKAILATSVLLDTGWAAYDGQGGHRRLEQAVYRKVQSVSAQDLIYDVQYLDNRKGCDDPDDPLKELNLYALLTTVAICNVMKTALISVNEDLARQYSVSYTAVAALTGVPLMLSAITGLASSIAARIWGRRPVILASMVVLFIGLVWNTRVTTSYGQFMAARIFQGFGWGAFDTLVVGSIIDTYFEHERSTKLATHRIVSVATLWGPPLIGGVTSQTKAGFSLQFEILAVFQIVSIPLLVLGAPETMFDRTNAMLRTPTTGWSTAAGSKFPLWARRRFSKQTVINYVKTVARPVSYHGPSEGVISRDVLLQAPRAMAAPTTVLAFMASFLPYALLWGFSASLSGLFVPAPASLSPATIGPLLAFPFTLSTTAVAVFGLWPSWSNTMTAFKTRSTHIYVLGAGSALSFIGILGFGLYVSNNNASTLRFSAVSFLLGLLAAGAYILDAPAKPLLKRSAQFTSPNLAISLRSIADMDAGLTVWRALFAGIFAMAIPSAIVGPSSAAGLKGTGIGVSVVQVLVAAALAAVWWMYEENIRKLDGRTMACRVDLTFLNNRASMQGSFFETED